MKILSIRGKNLASLAGEFSIDFKREPLASAGIFAITGQTGAGKSTILDALCLALYDDTPRLHNAAEPGVDIADVRERTLKQNDCRAIMRRGCAEAYAEVEFVSLTGDHYRTRWVVQRASGKADGTLKPSAMSLYNISQADNIIVAKKELLERITALIGLSFEQFTRAVLLAQGDFSTFMKAKGKEKAELLEKLTGTEIYSRISSRIYEQTRQADMDYKNVLEKIKDIELISEAEKQDLAEEKTAIEQSEAGFKKEIEVLTAKIKWLVDNLLFTNELMIAKDTLTKASKNIIDAKPRYEYLQLYDKAQSVRDLFSKLQKSIVDLSDNKAFIKNKRLLLNSTDEELKIATEGFAALDKNLQKVEEVWQLMQSEVAQAQELDVKIDEAGKRLKELVAELKLAQGRKESAEKNIADAEKRLQQLQSEDLTKELEQITAEQNRLNGLLSTEIKTLRERLQSGEPCPVCGSREHPFADKLDDSIEEKTLNEAKQKTENKIKTIQEKIEKHKAEVNQLQGKLGGDKDGLQSHTSDFAAKNAALESHKTLIVSLQSQRAGLLKGARVADFKLRYETKKKEIADRLESTRKSKDDSVRRLAELTGSITTKEKDIAALEKDIAELQSRKDDWLAAQNGLFTDAKLTEIFSKPSSWLDRERRDLQGLQDGMTSASAALTERQKIIDNHALAEIKPETEVETNDYLTENKRIKEAKLAEQSKRKTEIEVRFKHNVDNERLKEKYSRECAEKSLLFENWSKLNAVLGSADGSKFKKIAQEYTLDYLLAYSNKHLQLLTGRYELQRIPESLALQVVDLDMGNEVRTVHSLSGGESFLVSLALALGLSSLSSKRMKVESLFIDEGFGSLDADTLRIAMDALENLQTQGRKIGVISHVAEMTERISTQINVSKSSNGRSRVEVIGNN
jgi:exonuclease SbcC